MYRIIIGLTLLFGLPASAFACPSGQYSSMGMCFPEIGGSVGQGFEHLKKEIEAQTGGTPLEMWINASRNSAIGTSQPIPPNIRGALTGYVADDIMNRAHFKVGDNGIFNLAHVTLNYGDASAITLNDVIVFQNAADAFNNPSLWAHELWHVKQYAEWGVHSFAIQYARDASAVEAPAYVAGNGYNNWRANHGGGFMPVGTPSMQRPPMNVPPMNMPPMNISPRCGTPIGACMMMGMFPLGSPCWCPTPAGAANGQVF